MAKRGGFPGGGMPGNMANLMKQAQKMQRQMEEQAKELEAEGIYRDRRWRSSGSDCFRKTGSNEGNHLAEEVVDPDDIEMSGGSDRGSNERSPSSGRMQSPRPQCPI